MSTLTFTLTLFHEKGKTTGIQSRHSKKFRMLLGVAASTFSRVESWLSLQDFHGLTMNKTTANKLNHETSNCNVGVSNRSVHKV